MNIIEEWKKYDNFDNYLFSNKGIIKNIKTNKIINGSLYDEKLRTNLRDNQNKKCPISIHNVIAFLFVENKNNYKYVNHIDGNKINNTYINLEYVPTLQHINICDLIENEIWKEIDINNKYEISNNGRVRNKLTKCLLKQRCYNGYMSVCIGHLKKYPIHILVANAFIENIENKYSVDHIDKNRLNNNVDNLRWATNKEQCENRNWSKGDYYRKIHQIDKETKVIINIHNKVNDAVDYIYSNNLCNKSTQKNSIKSVLFKTLQCKKDTLYGYIWKYETNEDVFENEIWKSVKELYPDANDYKVSNLGRVKNPNGIFINGTKSDDYTTIYIGIKSRQKIHILVANLFIPNPENKRCVNHVDGNKTNNCVSNLEWNTHSENVNHAMDNNLNPCCKKIKVVNLYNKTEIIYPHIAKASRELNINRKTIARYIKKKEVYNNILFELI
jgi:hypothetical protein